tara:strand:- start:282 stop:458 length:177 start_codon:yes stop_codon:yes gene_type:complete
MGQSSSKTVSCDGTNFEIGKEDIVNSKHPLVYFSIPKSGKVECPYCGKVYSFDNAKNS